MAIGLKTMPQSPIVDGRGYIAREFAALLAYSESGGMSAVIDLTTDVTGVLPIANGGTGQITATLAFNALSPLTSRGDLLTNNGTNDIRLAIGTASRVLTSDGTDPSWGFLQQTILTSTDQSSTLPNSRRLIAGTGIAFDDTVANQRTVTADVTVDHVLMSDGTQPPLAMDDGNGNFLYVPYSV